jgi:nicotinamide-nucleotide amidase
MLEGLSTDVGISITGIAGPTGGTPEKPVGTVYIGIKIEDKYFVKRHQFKGDRNKIRSKAALTALFELQKLLKGKGR